MCIECDMGFVLGQDGKCTNSTMPAMGLAEMGVRTLFGFLNWFVWLIILFLFSLNEIFYIFANFTILTILEFYKYLKNMNLKNTLFII